MTRLSVSLVALSTNLHATRPFDKRWLRVPALIGFMLASASASQAQTVALVQSVSKDAGTTTSSTLAFTTNNTAGNWIAVAIRAGQSGQAFTVSDARGNTYRKALQLNDTRDGTIGNTVALYYAENIAGGPDTVTVADAIAGNTLRFAILEYAGIASTSSLDVTATTLGTSAAPNSGPATTTANGELVIGLMSTANSATFTAGSGYLIEAQAPAEPNTKLIVEDLHQTTAGSVSAGAALMASDIWSASVATFRPASGIVPPPPSLTSLSPSSGAVGTSVTIAGANFGATRGTSAMTFNGMAATPTSWSATSIVAPVPAGATTGNGVVTVSGVASNGVNFTVMASPSLTSLNPTSGGVGTSVTITGTNFGGTQGTNTVKFNGTVATPTGWSATSIVAPVPAGATTGTVVVTVGGQASNGVGFTVNPASGLPAPWTAQDVGGPALAGHATYASGAFSVTGAGVDIWNTSDQFQFVYQPLNGNGSIVALVSSLQNTDPWAKAGVMIRQDLTGGASNVMSAVTVGNGMTFQQRVTAGGTSTYNNAGFSGGAPYWVRLDRSGNTFTGYYSATGTAWILMGSSTVPMATNAYIGLAVTSRNPSALTVGTFSNVTVTTGPPPSPSLTSVNPTSGVVGTSVTITGTNFGGTQGTSTVTFNGTATTPTAWSATSIVVPVPAGATTGTVVVTVGGLASNAVLFTVSQPPPPPSLTSLNPASGATGTSVTITGANFGGTQGTSTVKFNGTVATPTSWSATGINAAVPSGATTGTVVVTVGGQVSNGVSFTVTASAPSLTSLSPTSGAVGTSVTIAGANFGATQGTSTVKFNGTVATPTNWSATSILGPVPNGATTGTVVVTVGGQASNGVGFTVNPASGLPAPWTAQDVGGPALAGHATYASGAFSVTGAGVDIWNTSDQFQFVYQPLNGNGSIVALVSSLQNTDPWAKAGVMIRQDLTGGASNVMSAVTVGNGMTFQQRVTAGGTSTYNNAGFSGGAPYWVRLDRSGNTFTGYYSATGTAWILMGSSTVPMATNAYIGLAVTSRNPSALTVGTFSNVTVTTGPPPSPSLTSVNPTSGVVGTSVTITGTNFGGTQGTSTVTFNGTATTPTAWSATSIVVPVPAGATTGTVVVTVGGLASNAVLFTVSQPPPPPSLTSLNPASGATGTSVTITGANFGGTQGTSTVKFNGTVATPTSWSATGINAAVPSGATTGTVVVTVGGLASNAITFTVIQTPTVTATWNANTESNIAGYVLSYGTQTGVYSTSVDVGNLTTWQGSLASGVGYYFAVKAYNTSQQFSAYSAEVFYTVTATGSALTFSVPANQTRAQNAAVSVSLSASQVAATTSTIIDPTIAAFWQLNDGVGTTALDASSHGMNGTLVNAPAWTAGRLGGALSFDGINDHVTTNFVENLPTWTVAAWVRSPAAPASASGSGPVHREKNFQINWNHPDAALRGAAALSVGGTWYAASFGPLAANTWYHLVGTYDGDTLRAYVNGVLATANSAPSGNPDLEPLALELGARAGAPSYFAGIVNGVRIYRRAIGPAEVAVLAQQDATPPTAVTLSASPEGQAVSLSWTAASDSHSGVSLYRIYRGTTVGGAKSPLAEGLATALSYQDRGAAPFTTYYYEVSAVNGNGVEGLGSNEAVVVTGETGPAPPTEIEAVAR